MQLVKIGPPGASPSGVSLDDQSADYDYANTYLNANLWHADAAKSIEYQAASAHMKQHYRKCARRYASSARQRTSFRRYGSGSWMHGPTGTDYKDLFDSRRPQGARSRPPVISSVRRRSPHPGTPLFVSSDLARI